MQADQTKVLPPTLVHYTCLHHSLVNDSVRLLECGKFVLQPIMGDLTFDV